MINYSIYNGDAKLVSRRERNRVGLISDGVSNSNGNIKVDCKYIYIKAKEDLSDTDKPIFFNNAAREAGYYSPSVANPVAAFLLAPLRQGEYGWALLEGLFEFSNNYAIFGEQVYFDSDAGVITKNSADTVLVGSYFMGFSDGKTLAFIKN
ncbi:MAG: hypothetical protein FWE18_03720 [Alphaproteobacteria bacterium]|nr:hypothetical protein [Alphaproteobacteria bacterium]